MSPLPPKKSFWWLAIAFLATVLHVASIAAQGLGEIHGTVTRSADQTPLQDVGVSLKGTGRNARTDAAGKYLLRRIPSGHHAIQFHLLGYAPIERQVEVSESISTTIDVTLQNAAFQLGEIVVQGASRAEERLLDAPSAISVVSSQEAQRAAITGQLPKVFTNMPGVDIIEGDLHDYKVTTRGFNPVTARTVLVLQDGRDVSIPWLGLQQWAALSMPADDIAAIEFIRGPASALYGANAFMGVINMITPEARDVVGTKIRVVGGELGTRQGDLRHAGLLAKDRVGYRFNLGYSESESWSRSRTRYDGQDFVQEYAPATDSALGNQQPERIPLNGQATDRATGAALGSPDDLISTYGSARVDWYADNGVGTIDAGVGRVQNDLAVVGSGRIQVIDHLRPWARVAWSASNYSLSAWYTGSYTLEPQVLLNSGARQEDASRFFHGEAQYHANFFQDRARVVMGASLREARINTKGTLLDPNRDDRHDLFYGAYGHAEYTILPSLDVIGGLRWDKSNLFDAEVTPRVGLLFRPTPVHAIRLTLNRAFLVPSHAELFLRLQRQARDLSTLEANLRGSSLGPALDGVPQGELFTTSAAVPSLILGNPDLVPQKVTSFELGYKGQVSQHVFATLDTYFDRKSDFVTALLPAPSVNSKFHPWTAPSAVPPSERQAVENAVRDSLADKLNGAALTRMPEGSTAFVLSSGNGGLVDEWGVEFGLRWQPSNEIQVTGSYAFYDFDIKSQQQGDVLQPNTPRNRGTVAVWFEGHNGIASGISTRFVQGYRWLNGVFQGYIPAAFTADLSATYRFSSNLRLEVIATNLLNHRHFEIYGGSVQGRRILGGITATF